MRIKLVEGEPTMDFVMLPPHALSNAETPPLLLGQELKGTTLVWIEIWLGYHLEESER